MDIEQDLRAVSDSLLRALERIQELEQQKRAEMPGTPTFVALAKQVEDLALEILRRSERQEGLARETAEMRAVGEAPDRPIEEMPETAPRDVAPPRDTAPPGDTAPPRELALILRDWRDAERRLVEAAAGSVEAREAAADARRLREEYARGYAAREKGRP